MAPGGHGSISQAVATIVGATYHLGYQGGTYHLGVDNAVLDLVSLPVPEVGSLALMAAGLLAVGAAARQRR